METHGSGEPSAVPSGLSMFSTCETEGIRSSLGHVVLPGGGAPGNGVLGILPCWNAAAVCGGRTLIRHRQLHSDQSPIAGSIWPSDSHREQGFHSLSAYLFYQWGFAPVLPSTSGSSPSHSPCVFFHCSESFSQTAVRGQSIINCIIMKCMYLVQSTINCTITIYILHHINPMITLQLLTESCVRYVSQ